MIPFAARLKEPAFPLLALIYAPWAAFFASLHFDPSVRKLDDGAQHLLIAKSLAQGMGFANVAMPGVPDFLGVPSAFPLLLMPYWWLPTPPETAAHLAMAVSLGLGGWLACLWLARFLPRWQAFLVALAFSSGPWFVVLSSTLLTEAPTVLFLCAGLWLACRDAERGGRRPEGWLALLCFLVLFRLRINTMPFLVLHLLVLLRRREHARWLTGAGLALLWLLGERLLGHGQAGGYLQHDLGKRFDLDAGALTVAAALLKQAAATAYSFLGASFGDLMLPWCYQLRPMDPLKRLAVLGLSSWAGLGLIVLWRRRPRLRPYLAAFALGWAPLLLQRSVALPRYAYPSFPLLAACLALPFQALAERFPRSTWRPAMAGLLLVIAVNQAAESLFGRGRDFGDIGEERAAYHHIHTFIRAAEPPPDVVLSHRHYHAHLETGRPALFYPDQWRYALEKHLLTGRERIWMVLPVPPAESGGWDLGPDWVLGPKPLTARGPLSLYEVRPRAPGDAARP